MVCFGLLVSSLRKHIAFRNSLRLEDAMTVSADDFRRAEILIQRPVLTRCDWLNAGRNKAATRCFPRGVPMMTGTSSY